ncbi:MAG: sulfotransferase [Bryobacteraceae bacterium]
MAAVPNFFVVGAPKAGTTSLYHYLDQHPEIFMSPIKEPNYFASEVRIENFAPELRMAAERDLQALRIYLDGEITEKRFGGIVSDWEDYVRLFRNAKEERAIGEASVIYLWSETSARNIQERLPDARIIMILRNPIDVAFSQYWHAVEAGAQRDSFRHAIESCVKYRERWLNVLNPFLQTGLYSAQVKRYLERFPPDRIRIYDYQAYSASPAPLLQDLFGFLGVDTAFRPDFSIRHLQPRTPHSVSVNYVLKKSGVWERLKKLCPEFLRPYARAAAYRQHVGPTMDPNDRRYLADYYREDVRKLSALLDRDFTFWLRS